MTQYTPATLVAAAARHMLAQGKPGYSVENGACMYETADGLRCAIGGLLPKEGVPADVLYGKSLQAPLQIILGLPPGRLVPMDIWNAAHAIQSVHDTWAITIYSESGSVRKRNAIEDLPGSVLNLESVAPGWREELGDDYPAFLQLIGVQKDGANYKMARQARTT